jgi:O-antigen/teichoic acid export membrane protein
VSRTGQLARALTIGYGYQAAVVVTGIVLTPILLTRLGTADYGKWLIIGQVLGILGLLDLGVTAVLPREVALAYGAGGDERAAEVTHRAIWLVGLQTPVAGLVSVVAWWFVSDAKPELNGPLAIILSAFVIQFPLRLAAAFLTGMQDLSFCGLVQAGSWLTTTAVSLGLVFADYGIYALAIGWAIGTVGTGLACWARARLRYPWSLRRSAWPGRSAVAGHIWPSLWTSGRQFAQMLVFGSDLLVLGWMMGPAAVVIYSFTTKMLSILNNQAYLLIATAAPALSELSGTKDRDRVCRASQALGLAMLILSGGMGIAILAANAVFTRWWVGSDFYGGALLTLLTVLNMIARHWVFTWLQTVFAFGYDRRLALAAVGDGIVTLGASIAWTSVVGLIGIPLGSLTGLVLTNGAVGLVTLAHAMQVSPLRVLAWSRPWLIRFAVVAAAVTAFSFSPMAAMPLAAGPALLVASLAYGLAVFGLATHEPLRPYSIQALATLKRRLGYVENQ